MATLRKRGNRYQAIFRRNKDGKSESRYISLGTTSKTIATKHLRRLENAEQAGDINVYGDFDFDAWLKTGSGDKPKSKLNLLAAIDLFIEAKENYRPKTRTGYQAILGDMASKVSPTMPLDSVNRSDIVEYLKTGNRKAISNNTYLRHIRVFFNWAVQAGYILVNPTDGIQKKPVDETLSQQIISEEQLNLLLGTHNDYITEQEQKRTITRDSQRQLWFRPLIMTYFYAGLRLSEALRLKWSDIDLAQRTMTVRSAKGGKSVVIVLTKTIVEELQRWQNQSKGKLVFPSPKPQLTKEIPLVDGTVQKILKKMIRRAGMDDVLHVHSLRHSCVTFLLSKGVDILTVNKTLRHSTLDITKGYEHLVPSDTRNQFEKLDI